MTVTIKTIRQKILDQAMRGDLVEQDPNDEPVEILLKRIEEEKKKLIKDKKIKKQKPLPPIEDDEVPYELPIGWKWVRLNQLILNIRGGGTPSKSNLEYWNGNIPWCSVKDLDEAMYLTDTQDKITQNAVNESSTILVPKGNLIVATRMGLGKIKITDIETAINQDLKALFIPQSIEIKFIYYYMKTIEFVGKGSTVKGITQDELLKTPVALPPYNEQKEIIERIEYLFSLCDKWEQEVSQQKGHLSLMRKKVLTDAVRGLLVEQDPNDEPAAKLLEEIEEDKQRLLKEKKIKKQKTLPPIEEDEIPYELPKGWKWIRLGNIIELISGRDLTRNNYNSVGKGIPYVMGASNIINDVLQVERWTEYPTVIGKKGDLLISVKGTVGKMVFQDIEETHLSRQIMSIRIIKNLEPMYLYTYMKTHVYNLQSNAKSFIPGISREDILLSKFPLPPLHEQKRIVDKIERIFAITNNIELKTILSKQK